MTSTARFSPSLAFWSLGALVAAVALGVVGQATGSEGVAWLARITDPLGVVWMKALRMTVIPLVVTQLLAALVGTGRASDVGKLGGKALALFLVLLTGAGLVTVAVTPSVLALFQASPEMVEAVRTAIVPEAARQAAEAGPVGLGEWLVALVPTNIFEAAARGDILQLLLATVVLGLAVGRLPHETRQPLADVFRALADAMMVIVAWVLVGTPVGVFALVLGLVLETGLDVVGLLGTYIVMLCGLLLLATAVVYPLTVAFGRTSFRTFARAVAPAQIVAMGTQSSLASLPALVEGGEDHLRLPREATGFVLPLCASTFKLNQAVSPVFRLFFLAWVFGIPLAAADIGAFLAYTIFTSFSVPGIPRGSGGTAALPMFLALGIPIEGVVLLEAVKTIPDIFMTLLNVTGDMSVATLLTRNTRGAEARTRAPGSPAGSPAAAASEARP